MMNERQMQLLRSIYDSIDRRKYKEAISIRNNKRVCDNDLVLVLKAHCLERLNQNEEAVSICRNVQRNKPIDDTLLKTLYLVFKLTGNVNEMIPSYEYACEKNPQNEELWETLFFCYVS